jgi:hypothetical protein
LTRQIVPALSRDFVDCNKKNRVLFGLMSEQNLSLKPDRSYELGIFQRDNEAVFKLRKQQIEFDQFLAFFRRESIYF